MQQRAFNCLLFLIIIFFFFRYFTWDLIKFSDPIEMIANLTARGRKLVVIVDPHIKRDGGYFLHNDAEQNGYYIKNKDGKDFEGNFKFVFFFIKNAKYIFLFIHTVSRVSQVR